MKRRSEKGQAIIEFAIVLPILLLILCGIIDFGWIFYSSIMLNNACRESARYTAIHINDSPNDDDAAEALRVALESTPLLPRATTAQITEDEDSVTVTLSSPIAVLTGMSSIFVGGKTKTVTATSTMRIEQ